MVLVLCEGFGFGEVAEKEKEEQAKTDKRNGNNEGIRREEAEVEELACERNTESANDDGDDDGEEATTEEIDGLTDLIDHSYINCECNEEWSSENFGASNVVEIRHDRKRNHGGGDSDTYRYGVVDDIADKLVLDPSGVMLKSEDETRKTDAGKVEERHLNRCIWILEWDEGKGNSQDGSINSLTKE